MYHYNIEQNKQALELVSDYKKFVKEYNNYIKSIADESTESVTFKRKKFLVDQLVDDLNRSHKKVDAGVFNQKLVNTQIKLDEIKVDFLKGMLNDGLPTK